MKRLRWIRTICGLCRLRTRAGTVIKGLMMRTGSRSARFGLGLGLFEGALRIRCGIAWGSAWTWTCRFGLGGIGALRTCKERTQDRR